MLFMAKLIKPQRHEREKKEKLCALCAFVVQDLGTPVD